MSFEIAARTILHLGADLIESDAIAVYELIKNAIDAQSKDGVDVDFHIVLLADAYEAFIESCSAANQSQLAALKAKLFDVLEASAPQKELDAIKATVSGCDTPKELLEAVQHIYRTRNRIIVSDRGDGMTESDLKNIFLKIGTANRAHAVNKAVSTQANKSPYLGEKGVGRLAAMRLGRHLLVESSTASEDHQNTLEIDWTRFEEAYDKPASSIVLVPKRGKAKAKGVGGTTITISNLRSAWTLVALKRLIVNQITRLTDPFSFTERRRFRIRIRYNGEAVEYTRSVVAELLDSAHGTCKGRYEITAKGPKLTLDLTTSLYPTKPITETYDVTDLASMSGIREIGESRSSLTSLGPFDFEIYWFNRQRLRALEGIGDRNQVRDLMNSWAGINLFRDGYRVLPYGDPGDDWLNLDVEALAASGYKLNTKQLIGRVRIGRVTNPGLLDQTNRQGLIDRPEKRVLVGLLNWSITRRLHDFLNEAQRLQKSNIDFDARAAATQVDELEKRAKDSIRTIRRHYSGDAGALQKITDLFREVKDAHERAVERIGAMELEKERLTQLAGVGLMIEVIAHELTRATESTQFTLKEIKPESVDEATAAAFRSLEKQLRNIHRRLRILEPLTIPSRQRRAHEDLGKIAEYVLMSHDAQFQRHEIVPEIKLPKEPAIAFLIEGHVVQILENLIVNSVYWLDVHKEEHKDFEGKINLKVLDSPPRIRVSDNGPGIPTSRADIVFDAFFSTKASKANRRSGLGLFVARQNAELLGGTLELVDEGSVHDKRFNTFELTLKANSGK